MGGSAPATKLLTDPATLEAERKAREEEDARRAEELRAREAALKEREDKLQKMLDEGMERLAGKFASKGFSVETEALPSAPKAPVKATASQKAAAPPIKAVQKPPAATKATKATPAKIAAKPSVAANVDYSSMFAEMFPDDDSVPL